MRTRRKRPSSSDTASCPLSWALIAREDFLYGRRFGRLGVRHGPGRDDGQQDGEGSSDPFAARGSGFVVHGSGFRVQGSRLRRRFSVSSYPTCAAARVAAARPSATQSGTPIEWKPLPATKSPGKASRRCSTRDRRAACPTLCWAPARGQRCTRTRCGAPAMRSTAGDVAASRCRRARHPGDRHAPGSRAPPRKARSRTMSGRARSCHLDETHVHAVMRKRLCWRATTKPLPARG